MMCVQLSFLFKKRFERLTDRCPLRLVLPCACHRNTSDRSLSESTCTSGSPFSQSPCWHLWRACWTKVRICTHLSSACSITCLALYYWVSSSTPLSSVATQFLHRCHATRQLSHALVPNVVLPAKVRLGVERYHTAADKFLLKQTRRSAAKLFRRRAAELRHPILVSFHASNILILVRLQKGWQTTARNWHPLDVVWKHA